MWALLLAQFSVCWRSFKTTAQIWSAGDHRVGTLHRAKPWRGGSCPERKLRRSAEGAWGLRTDWHIHERELIKSRKRNTKNVWGFSPYFSYYTCSPWTVLTSQPIEFAALSLNSIPLTGEWTGKGPQGRNLFKCESHPLVFPSFKVCNPSDFWLPFIPLQYLLIIAFYVLSKACHFWQQKGCFDTLLCHYGISKSLQL